MDGGIGFRRDNKKMEFIKSYKRRRIVESHDHQSPKWTWYIEEDRKKKEARIKYGGM